MPRSPRIDIGGEIYHCLNRSVGKHQIFHTNADYNAFEQVLQEACVVTSMRILAYCVMPNHFHLVLYPTLDGDLSNFMKKLTLTHTLRYRVATETVGEGPVYQGRYKSFLVQNDEHLLTLLRYVERNPLTANLVKDPLAWKYSSLYRRYQGDEKAKMLLAAWPTNEPDNYIELLKQPLTTKETKKIEYSEMKSGPYGRTDYVFEMIEKYNLRSVLRPKGRPKKIISKRKAATRG